ncbi:hypothetical protein CTEN210_01271 [Chaetoceros tenuissimus]|uniref:HSF-type DNA-binding domain-containing protein n=1 Tax=Chaetoceros tenuissimus TaxID=426638 RepID=A0AAD3CET2_9STRA|nr:hypothetical protein CTEN210_01271 [Chaetoceros tenuissimus]
MNSKASKPTSISSNEKVQPSQSLFSYSNISKMQKIITLESSSSSCSHPPSQHMPKSNLLGKRMGDRPNTKPSAPRKKSKKISSEKSAIQSSIASITPKLSNKGGVKYPFPVKLHHLLEQESATIVHIISWRPDGRTFRVHDKKAFEMEIQNLYFDQSHYASFRRQLNLWGFMRVAKHDGMHDGVYFHPLFRRGDKESCYIMERLKKGEKKEAAIVTPAQVEKLISTNGTSTSSSSSASNALVTQSSQDTQSELSMANENLYNSVALNAVDPTAHVTPIMATSSSNGNSNSLQEIEQLNLNQLQSLQASPDAMISSLISSLQGSGNNLNGCDVTALQQQLIAQQLLPSYLGMNSNMQDTALPNQQLRNVFDIQSSLNNSCTSVENLQTTRSDQVEGVVDNATGTTSTPYLPYFPTLPESIDVSAKLSSKDESANNACHSTNYFSSISNDTPTSSQSEKGQTMTSSSSMNSLPLNISWASFSQFQTLGDKLQSYSPIPSPEPFPHDKYLVYEEQADEQAANSNVSTVTLEDLEEMLKDLRGKGKCYKNALYAHRT